MKKINCCLGLDFWTKSARKLVLKLIAGEETASVFKRDKK